MKERKLPGVIRHRDYDGQTNTRNARRGRAGEELAARDGIKASGFQLEKSKWSSDGGKLDKNPPKLPEGQGGFT